MGDFQDIMSTEHLLPVRLSTGPILYYSSGCEREFLGYDRNCGNRLWISWQSEKGAIDEVEYLVDM